jgi:MFS family permease
MYSFFSIKWVYLVAISIFELGSLICGAAPSSSALIVGRAIAGLGSAGVFSGALIIVAYSVPLRQRPMYSGAIGAMYGIASVAGPLLGGVFTDKATWRLCFYINLPIGAITIGVIIFYFKPPGRAAVSIPWSERINQLDLLGTIFFMPAVICLLLALQWGGSKYPWDDARVIALFVLFGVLIIVFLVIQYYKGDNATVPPRILKQRSVAAGCWFAFCLGSSFFIMIYYLPVWFQGVQNVSAVESGIRNLPMVLGLVLVSLISGVGVSTMGYYTPWMIASSIVMPIGYGLITTFTPATGSREWIGYQALAGVGVGLGMQQPLMAVQTVLDIKDVPTGTSVLIFLQTLGGALFVSVAQNVFTNKLKDLLTQNVPDLNPEIVLYTGATSLQSSVPAEYLPGVIISYNDALVHAFIVPTAIAAASLIGSVLMEWKSVKGKKVEMAIA